MMQTPTSEERTLLEAGAGDVLAVLFETDGVRLPELIVRATRRAYSRR